jgi:hypothetical protein
VRASLNHTSGSHAAAFARAVDNSDRDRGDRADRNADADDRDAARVMVTQRIMKAGASGAGCGRHVLRGEQIIRRDSKWTCLPCALAAIRGTRAV